ncbi:MAG: DUF87 domain-containing protein [Desulfobacterales bacterium]
METYEKLGAFYLGKVFDPATRGFLPDLLLYDAKDLTTHAVIIGMTGSGKTGLGVGLIEEALIDKIPVIAIDPKGDLANLALTFPSLSPEELKPWVNPQEAVTQGLTLEAFAKKEADKWTQGLADWDQSPERIARLKQAAELTVYTPGSSAGAAVSVLRKFSAPPENVRNDPDLMGERIETTTSSLMALLGLDADPLTSREHILTANIFRHVWTQGQGLDLPGLIQAIQNPGFERIGIMDLETFYPAKERFALAMRLNNLLAAPGFEAWLEGTPLNIADLLYTPAGKPRAAIFSISHLSDAQRMFFVAMLLNELLGWMRTQSGTSSLRALLYMDEIFGYFPPVQNPPSKAPLLRLLKQARAFGLGVVLSTQNPVDLDYRGLSNTGTWFIGRLQTERDQEKVMAGLRGSDAGQKIDPARLGQLIAALGKRTFLLHNVHETAPVVFQTRWALSYLAGPLTREQIKQLPRPGEPSVQAAPGAAPAPAAPGPLPAKASTPPPIPPDIQAYYVRSSGAGQGLTYYPAVLGQMDIHYHSAKYKVDQLTTLALATEIQDGPLPVDWDGAQEIPGGAEALDERPLPGAIYGDLPAPALNPKAYRDWEKDLQRHIRANYPLSLWRCNSLKLASEPGESEGAFRSRISLDLREKRDLAVGKLRRKYTTKFTTLNNRLMAAEQAISREQEQAKGRQMDTVISFGTAILGAFMGRKVVSARSTSRVGTAMKSAGRMHKEKMDVARAQEKAAAIRQQMAEMEARLQADIDRMEIQFDPESESLEEIRVTPRLSDVAIQFFGLAWLPFRKSDGGRSVADW